MARVLTRRGELDAVTKDMGEKPREETKAGAHLEPPGAEGGMKDPPLRPQRERVLPHCI